MTAAAPIYRALMVAIEARRLELGIAMATVDDMAGLQSGYFSKMIYPDTPSGRQARWETVQLAVEALFGKDFKLTISSDEIGVKPSMLGIDKGKSTKYLQYRHWRHRAHFQKLGSDGGKARIANLAESGKLKAAQRKAAKARWRKARQAQRQGQKHRAANARVSAQ